MKQKGSFFFQKKEAAQQFSCQKNKSVQGMGSGIHPVAQLVGSGSVGARVQRLACLLPTARESGYLQELLNSCSPIRILPAPFSSLVICNFKT